MILKTYIALVYEPASKVNGPMYGVAKKVNLVVVKARTQASDTDDALDKILEDIRIKNLQGKAIVNISRCREWSAADINIWPALMAGDGVLVINVGAVDNTGKNATFSQGGPLVHVMAPGVQLRCATKSSFFGTRLNDGTSFAAPAVAGLAAYLLALGEYPELYEIGKVAANMQGLLMDIAYQLSPTGGQVVYNGQVGVCGRPRSAKFKRQDLSCRDCSAVSSTTTLAPTPSSATPAPGTLSSFNELMRDGALACFPVSGFTATAGTTYGFLFDVTPDMIASIQIGLTNEGHHQSKGPWIGTFLAQSISLIRVCGSGSGSLVFKFTEEPLRPWPIRAPAGNEVFKLDEKVTAGATSCFLTTGLKIQEGNYGFSYTTLNGIETQIGDDSSGPKYPTTEQGFRCWSSVY
ncbi:hypothetical protein EsH8_II_001584 [Colletotrichum jinshuiense]